MTIRYMKYARTLEGLHEIKNNRQLTKVLEAGGFKINPAKTAWCAAYVNTVLNYVGIKGTGKLTARSFLKLGKTVKTPKYGDIVVFKRGKLPWQGHVAFFIDKTPNGSYVCLGGNQANQVCERIYSSHTLLGIRRV